MDPHPHPSPSMRSHLSSSHCGVRSSCQSQSIRLPHAQLGGSVGYVGPLARSTFYPCRHLGRTPYASCAVERVAANPLHQSAPSLKTVSLMLTQEGNGRLDPWCMLQTLSMTPMLGCALLSRLSGYGFFHCAPSGIETCSNYGHKAISSRRARATMPTRRMRLPAPPKRRLNHALS